MINHRNAPSIDMNLFIYITSLLYILSSSCTYASSSTDRPPSKLLSIVSPKSNTNKLDTIHYFKSYHYTFPINEYDDINTINISPETIIITTHLNETLFTLPIKDFDISITKPLSLQYDTPSDWNEIYESNVEYINKMRRRLGWWNHAKHKGRYIADGIARRFKDAKNYCRHLYGDLASIMSKQEEEQVKDVCAKWNQGNCWVGFEKPWGHWSDGRRPVYLHWKPGEPNNYGGNEGCAEISSSGLWNDIKCTLSRIAICERPRIHVVGHYVAVMRSLPWHQAGTRCQELFSTDLATIENARENIMVRRACSALDDDADCWIGLKRPFRTWNDGEDAKIKNFADNEPNNAGGNENCVAIMSSQRWNDANCAVGKYFVCNTITQDVRVKKRSEAKRRRQEKEAELEKKRKKMEDQIMDRYMKQNQNSMMQKMQNGQGLYGAGGIGSSGGNMMAYSGGMPNAQQMYQMGSRQGQHNGMFNHMLSKETGSMGGVGQMGHMMHQRSGYQYNHGGLDNGGAGSNIPPGQMSGLYGDLGPLGSGNGAGGWKSGHPLKVQLIGGGQGGQYGQQYGQQQGQYGGHYGQHQGQYGGHYGQHGGLMTGNNLGGYSRGAGFGFRRRMQVDEHENEGNMDEIYGKKCRILSNRDEICIGHDYVNVRKYSKGVRKDKKGDVERRFKGLNVIGNYSKSEEGFDEDFIGYELWKYDGDEYKMGGFNDYVQYILSKEFVYDMNEDRRCFEYYDNYKLCMDNEGEFSVNNSKENVFRFVNDNDWDYIEFIEKNNNVFGNVITNKCRYVYSGDIETKICIQQTYNKNDELWLYKAVVQFLATSGHKDHIYHV